MAERGRGGSYQNRNCNSLDGEGYNNFEGINSSLNERRDGDGGLRDVAASGNNSGAGTGLNHHTRVLFGPTRFREFLEIQVQPLTRFITRGNLLLELTWVCRQGC